MASVCREMLYAVIFNSMAATRLALFDSIADDRNHQFLVSMLLTNLSQLAPANAAVAFDAKLCMAL